MKKKDTKARLLANIVCLMRSKMTPDMGQLEALTREIEVRLSRSLSRFLGHRLNDATKAQINASALDVVDDVLNNHKGTISPDIRPFITQCEKYPSQLHAMAIPSDYSGVKSYPCGCQVMFIKGRKIDKPIPPQVRFLAS